MLVIIIIITYYRRDMRVFLKLGLGLCSYNLKEKEMTTLNKMNFISLSYKRSPEVGNLVLA